MLNIGLTSRIGMRLLSLSTAKVGTRSAPLTTLSTSFLPRAQTANVYASIANTFSAQRQFSSGLVASLDKEIEEEMENKFAGVDELLSGSGFTLAVLSECSTVLQNGNTYLSFDANELETEGEKTTLPLTIRVARGSDMLVIDAVATENEEEDSDEGLMEEFGFEITGMTVLRNDIDRLLDDPSSVGSEDQYSPFYDDLDPNLQDEVMRFLVDSGLRPDTAKIVFEVAESVEHKVYVNWLETMRRFAAAA